MEEHPLLWMGPDTGLTGSAVPETRKCPPSGFTVCLQAVALAATASSLLHHYV